MHRLERQQERSNFKLHHESRTFFLQEENVDNDADNKSVVDSRRCHLWS
jgi:hypothetical protein